MREMKDSGIEWIGAIPKHWKVKKTKYVCDTRNQRYEPSNGDLDYFALENIVSWNSRYVPTESKYDLLDSQLCYKNDVVFGKLRPYLAKTFLVDYDRCCSSEFAIFCDFDGVANYYLYVFTSQGFVETVDNSTTGVKMPRANIGFINNVYVPWAPIDEQTSIAHFLNRKCAEIDTLIEEIQSMIDVLEQYKKSVITEAVTRGLNPNVEMIASGVAWCPQIPKHWKYTNPKALFALRDDRAIPHERQLTASQEHGIVYQDEYMEMTGNRVVTVQKDFSILKHVEPNDFVISMRSFQGGLEYSEKRGCISSAYVMLIPNQNLVFAPFYRWFFKSSKYINAIQSTSNLVRDGQAMRYANFAQVPLFIVPIEEQKEIAAYLDEKVSHIDAVIKEKQEMLDTLAEYKKSLIYEYVTGKKEVPAVNDAVVVLFDPNALWLGLIADKLGKNQRGRTQIQKIKYLLDIHCGINPTKQYYRYDHGPYDVNLNAYLDNMVEQRWFKQERDGTITLTAGECHADFQNICKDQLGDKEAVIDGFLSLLQSMNVMKTRRLERIATLYAVWNDFLLDGITPTDDQIIQEVLSNWTENKKHFKYETWQGSLNKMKEHGLIPKGTGLHTLSKPEKDGEEAE